MSNILEVQGLKKKYANSDFSLDDISFSLPSGSIMGFVGENGAGKTTTISCILNTLSKDSGEIKIFGQEVSDKNIDIREDIGVVFDAGNFSGSLTAKQISKIMRGIYKRWDNAVFEKYLTKFCLPFNQKLKTFSKGMSMKLAIAVAYP